VQARAEVGRDHQGWGRGGALRRDHLYIPPSSKNSHYWISGVVAVPLKKFSFADTLLLVPLFGLLFVLIPETWEEPRELLILRWLFGVVVMWVSLLSLCFW
jgi:hypothetical protein